MSGSDSGSSDSESDDGSIVGSDDGSDDGSIIGSKDGTADGSIIDEKRGGDDNTTIVISENLLKKLRRVKRRR